MEGKSTLTADEVEQLRGLLAAAGDLNPGALSAEDYFLRGDSYYEAGQLQKTLASRDRAIALDPNLAIAWYNKSEALQHLGREEEAQESFRRARELEDGEGGTSAPAPS